MIKAFFTLFFLVPVCSTAQQIPSDKIQTFVQVITVDEGKEKTVFTANRHLEAPNWTGNDQLLMNGGGLLYLLPAKGGKLRPLNIDTIKGCNNDHGFSPDGRWLAISHNVAGKGSYISVLPAAGGKPEQVTMNSPSYWHGWSRDGKTLAYCAPRNGNFDIYTIPVTGGEEKRLTTEEGLDDGPEYSPDGKYIYFNSYRSGRMQIWRMGTDGSHPEQLTDDELANWFPHISPDGKQMAFISYLEDQKQDHPFGKRVKLRIMNMETKKISDLTKEFFGGQGSFNVPSWSPDSKKLAYIRYRVRK
ncbi:MAG: TolB family protein [Mucilaginibacter polytrichastri]|nr:TolB family protein [Mucilaginibacter polytrichastri]